MEHRTVSLPVSFPLLPPAPYPQDGLYHQSYTRWLNDSRNGSEIASSSVEKIEFLEGLQLDSNKILIYCTQFQSQRFHNLLRHPYVCAYVPAIAATERSKNSGLFVSYRKLRILNRAESKVSKRYKSWQNSRCNEENRLYFVSQERHHTYETAFDCSRECSLYWIGS